MEKASGGSSARTTRKTDEDEGRRRGRVEHEAKRICARGAQLPSYIPPRTRSTMAKSCSL